jgi:transcriptional regulator with XRE-family HTH domain
MSLPAIRRSNVLILFGDFVAEHASHGAEPLGLAAKFAEKLQISASMWSQIKKGRVISDKLARQIENGCGKEALWLDASQSAEPLTDPGEERFVELARKAYRAQNARGKRALRTILLEHGASPKG